MIIHITFQMIRECTNPNSPNLILEFSGAVLATFSCKLKANQNIDIITYIIFTGVFIFSVVLGSEKYIISIFPSFRIIFSCPCHFHLWGWLTCFFLSGERCQIRALPHPCSKIWRFPSDFGGFSENFRILPFSSKFISIILHLYNNFLKKRAHLSSVSILLPANLVWFRFILDFLDTQSIKPVSIRPNGFFWIPTKINKT